MSVLYDDPVKSPGDRSRLAKADLRSPYALADVHARIEAETMPYAEAIFYLSSRNPRIRAKVVEFFMGYVFENSFVLWRTVRNNVKLDVILEAAPGGTIITVTSDIRNLALSNSGIAIGLALPAVVGFGTAAIIAQSWIFATIATAVGVWAFIYVRFIRERLASLFERDVETLLAIVDPYGRRDNSTAIEDSLGDDPDD